MLMQQTAKIYLLTLDVNWRIRLQFSTLCSRNPMTRQPLFIYLFCHLKKKNVFFKRTETLIWVIQLFALIEKNSSL
jgi:hypothetical protein